MTVIDREVSLQEVAGRKPRTGTLVLVGFFIAYAVLGLIVLTHHEPWRDEAQAWLIARDLTPYQMFFEQMGHEGTPALWHLLNALLIELGLPYAAQAYLNFAFAVATVGLIFWRAPFPPFLKILFAFNYYMAYEFAEIARNFALGTFLLTAVLALFEQRHRRSILFAVAVAFLANANVFTFLMAIAFGLIFAVEAVRDRRIGPALLPALVMAAGGLFAFVQMIPAADNFRTEGAIGMFNMFMPEHVVQAAFDLFFGLFEYKARELAQRWPIAGLLIPAMAVFCATFWLLFLLYIRKSWAALLFFAIVAGNILYIVVFKKGGLPRVHGHLLIAAMGALWLQALLHQPVATLRLPWGMTVPALWLRRAFMVVLCVGLGLSVARTGQHWYKDIRYPFSGAENMAAYLRESGLDARPIVAYESAWGSAVLPYLARDTMFYYPDLQRFGSFLVWTRQWRARYEGLPFDEILRSAEAGIGTLEGVLFLMSHPVDDPRVELLHEAAQHVNRETLYLYRLRGAAPKAVP